MLRLTRIDEDRVGIPTSRRAMGASISQAAHHSMEADKRPVDFIEELRSGPALGTHQAPTRVNSASS